MKLETVNTQQTARQIETNLPDQSLSQVQPTDMFAFCAQCGFPVASIKGDSHNYCQNCGFRDSCC